MMGISTRGTLTEQAKLLLDKMGMASSQHSPGAQARSARAIDDAEGARASASSHRTPGPECEAPGRSTTPRERVDAATLRRRQHAYKVDICSQFKHNGKCDYGKECRFAHDESESERRPRVLPILYKTAICNTFSAYGSCP